MVDDRARRAARDKAMARPEMRGGEIWFDFEIRQPDTEKPCTVTVTDGFGTYKLPFAVVYRGDDGWFNPKHGGKALKVRIVKWRYA